MFEVLFWVFAVLGVGGGLAAITLRNPLYCALSLVVSFVSLAGLYFQLKAAFPGILQVLLYAGAVMVLVIFVIMLLNAPEDLREDQEYSRAGVLGTIFLLIPLAALLIGVIWSTGPTTFPPAPDDFGGVSAVGVSLFTDWVYPFEVLSLLILAAMVGAVLLAKKRIT